MMYDRRQRGAKFKMMKEEKRTIYISASANEILTDYFEDRGYAITRIGASDCVSAKNLL